MLGKKEVISRMKSLQERLQKNYYRIHPVTDFRDLLRQSAQRHTKRIAFRWKDARGVQEVTYESAYTCLLYTSDNSDFM